MTEPAHWHSHFICTTCGAVTAQAKTTAHKPLLDGIPMMGWGNTCGKTFAATVVPGTVSLDELDAILAGAVE